jgi:hypothetical protein
MNIKARLISSRVTFVPSFAKIISWFKIIIGARPQGRDATGRVSKNLGKYGNK